MNVLSAVISGILGSFAISMVMAVAPLMGMPKMDIVDMLSTMFGKPNRVLGWMMHLMMGAVFALIYAFLWSQGIGSPAWLSGLIFGAAHWLVVGLMMDHACRDKKRRRGSPWSVDDQPGRSAGIHRWIDGPHGFWAGGGLGVCNNLILLSN